MNRKKQLSAFCSALVVLLCATGVSRAAERRTNFDRDWKFYRGSVANAEQPDFDDSGWRTVFLPHDWSVEPVPVQREGITIGPFSRLNEGGAGGSDVGQTVGGEGWYRKTFVLPAGQPEKLSTLYFEGVYNQSEVWVNGRKVNFNPYGYTSYKIDVTDYCRPAGEPNVVAVKVVNAGENSRWYSGSGIYRHVWLIETDRLHLEEWDTHLDASELSGKDARVRFSSILHNKTGRQTAGTWGIRVFSPEGKEVFSASENTALSSETPVSREFTIERPELWSLETPVLYRAEITLSSEGTQRDRIVVPFGIRTVSVSAEQGFLLNGRPVELRGGCVHHDNGLLGAAAIDRAEERKVELLIANGYNAVRCSHNQVSEAFLDACDRLGMLVIHETFDQWQQAKRRDDYHRFFDEWSDRDLAASVRRDRNHPAIVMWSIGNEIAQRADEPAGQDIARRLIETIRRYDSSRLTTMGVNEFWDRSQFTWDGDSHRAFNQLDVAGYNYVWRKYESDHAAYPERVMYGSESFPKEAAANWNLVEKHPYVIGDFVWTAIDYLGEAGLGHAEELAEGERNTQLNMGWPWYNAWCGDIDFCGDKKPQSYYRDILWRRREIAMAVRRPVAAGKREVVNGWGWTDELTSWNWDGLEGEPMRVNVYSRSPKVRLYLNGRLVGERETGAENYTAVFEVPYEPGELKAVNVSGNREGAPFTLRTAGEVAGIRLSSDRPRIGTSRNELSYVRIELIDRDGNLVPDSDHKIEIRYSGVGSVIASGNAAPTDMESFRSLTPKTFRGVAMAIVQPTDETAGDIRVSVTADGLPPASVTIRCE